MANDITTYGDKVIEGEVVYDMRQLGASAKAHYDAAEAHHNKSEEHRRMCAEETMALATDLLHGRNQCHSDNVFSEWLSESNLGHIDRHEREALLNMARFPEASMQVLVVTTRKSRQHIWEQEIKPLCIPHVGEPSTPPAPVEPITRREVTVLPPQSARVTTPHRRFESSESENELTEVQKLLNLEGYDKATSYLLHARAVIKVVTVPPTTQEAHELLRALRLVTVDIEKRVAGEVAEEPATNDDNVTPLRPTK